MAATGCRERRAAADLHPSNAGQARRRHRHPARSGPRRPGVPHRPGHGPGLQRAWQRDDRPDDRAAHRGGRRDAGLPPAAAARAAGGDEHQGRLGLGQEHDAAAAARARQGARPRLGRFRPDQPRHLAQVSARLRQPGRGEQIRRLAHRPRAQDHRPEARSLHGPEGRARSDVPSADRSLPLRQLRRGGRGRGGRAPADPLRRGGLHVLHDHAADRDGRARLAAGSGGRALQGGRRPARSQRRSLHRDAAPVLHLGATPGQAGPLRVPRQRRGGGRAPAHRRLRLERRDEHPRHRLPARRRTLSQDRHGRKGPGGGSPRPGGAGGREQHRLPAALRAHDPEDQSRGSSDRADLCPDRGGGGRWDRPGGLGRGHGRITTPGSPCWRSPPASARPEPGASRASSAARSRPIPSADGAAPSTAPPADRSAAESDGAHRSPAARAQRYFAPSTSTGTSVE